MVFLWLSPTNLQVILKSGSTYLQITKWKLNVFKILLITPFTNAKVERMFSRMTRIKTDWRNGLGHDKLDSLLRISEEGHSLERSDPTPTIECWFNYKFRHLTSLSHKYPEKQKIARKGSGRHCNTNHARPWRWRRRVGKFWLSIVYSWMKCYCIVIKK